MACGKDDDASQGEARDEDAAVAIEGDAALDDGSHEDPGASDGSTPEHDSGTTLPCAPAAPRDDFSAAKLDSGTWRTIGFMGWTPEVVDGRLSFTPRSGYTNTRTGMLRSIASFDLSECATWIELAQALPPDISGEMTVALATANGDNVGFMRARQGSLYLSIGGVEGSTQPFDATAHRWWRFREASGILSLETSPDAHTWNVQFEHAHGRDVSAVSLVLNVIETSTTDTFEAPQFDNVNVLP